MQCPECLYRTMLVVKSVKTNTAIKRTRECPKCEATVKTIESAIDQPSVLERLERLEKSISSQI